MSQFIIAYYGGKKFESTEESQLHMADFNSWLSSIGGSIISAGTPLSTPVSLDSSGNIVNKEGPAISGFTIVEAEKMVDAVVMAKNCPHLKIGTVDVFQVLKM